MRRISTSVLLGLLLAPWLAHAGPITFQFTGIVTQVPIDDLGTGIQSGDSIVGVFTFESTAVDAIAAPTAGSYTSTGPAYGISAAIGPGASLFAVSGSMNIGILNSFVDQYTAHAASPTLVLDLFFQDNTASVFSGDSLPLTPPPLAGFAQREFHLDQTDVAGQETQVDGTITSLTCSAGCIAQTAPEPATAGLLFAGTVLIGAWRIRKFNARRTQ
jgi:hypothetical protein